MRSKSFAVRSRPHRAPHNSLDPYPSSASLPGEANERFGDAADVETVPDTFDKRDVPTKKRHCLGTSETTRGGGRSNLEPCIVCDISDELVSRCSGTDCFISFHGECLNPDSEDLAKNYCPYCWFKVVVTKHKSVREKAVGAEKEVSKYLSEETKSKDDSVDQELRGEKGVCSAEKEQLQAEKDSERSREEDMPLTEETGGQRQEDIENFQDAEEDTDVSPVSSGKEQDQMPRRRRRQLILNDIDSDISSDESSNERNVEDVTTPSGTMKNQQRKQSSTTKSTTMRDMSSFKSDQRKRLFWTPEEEEMLKVGVEKFSAEAKKNMPWRKILEMGEEVFHETRTPADLKDKWRNMTVGGRGKKTN